MRIAVLASSPRAIPTRPFQCLLTQEGVLAIQIIGSQASLLTHAPGGHHATSQACCLFEIIFRSRCDLTKGYFLSCTTSSADCQALEHVGTWRVAPIILR